MKKQVILLSLAASILTGGVTSWAVASLSKNQNKNQTSAVEYTDRADNHFASTASTQGLLPDLTVAAEMGVSAVVNIEKREKVTSRGYYGGSGGGGGVDPFELFFGPQQRSQQPQQQERRSGGSGVIISPDGYIVSNNHVVENASELKVTLHDGSTHNAKIIGTDPTTDIALIKIEAENLPVLPFGKSEDLKLGEWVLAIGNPYGLTSTVTAGIVSAKGRALGVIPSQMGIESFIQTDAAVNPGNSGGALVTVDGSLVGINTVIKSPTGSYTGYSFAVPSSIVRKIVADLREYGIVQRAMLGIAMSEISDQWIEQFGKETGVKERGGIYIGEVSSGGAAEAAGIKKGDILVAINDAPINTSSQVQESIAKFRPNDKIKISVKRDGVVKHFEVTLRNKSGKTELVSKDDIDMMNVLGAQFREITDKQKKELKINGGIQVTALNQDGLLARSRVKAGYIITAINDNQISTINDLNMITDNVQSIDGVYPDGRFVSYHAIK